MNMDRFPKHIRFLHPNGETLLVLPMWAVLVLLVIWIYGIFVFVGIVPDLLDIP